MKKLILAGIIALITGGIPSFSQSSLQISAGPSWLARQDLLFSPLIAKNVAIPAIEIAYFRSGSWEHRARAGYRSFAIAPVSEYQFWRHAGSDTLQTLPHFFTFADLSYGLGKKIAGGPRAIFSLGGNFSADVDALNYNYGGSGSFGYFASFSLGAWAECQWELAQRHTLSLGLQIPLLSWIARSPYLLNDDTFIENTASHSGVKTFLAFIGDGKLQTWTLFRKVAWSFEHRVTLSEHWTIGWAYLGEFFYHSRPMPLSSLQQDLALTVQFNF